MSRFERRIREVGVGLALPRATRDRILREVAADFEGLYRSYLERGLEAEEAERRALAVLAPDAEPLHELVRLHRPFARRLLDRFAGRGPGPVLHRALLFLLGAGAVVFGITALGHGDLIHAGSAAAWPFVTIASLCVAVSAAKLVRLHVLRDHRPAAIRAGSAWIPGLAGGALFIVAFAAVLDLYRVAIALTGEPDRTTELLFGWTRSHVPLLGLCLVLGIAAGLVWIALYTSAATAEQDEVDAIRSMRV